MSTTSRMRREELFSLTVEPAGDRAPGDDLEVRLTPRWAMDTGDLLAVRLYVESDTDPRHPGGSSSGYRRVRVGRCARLGSTCNRRQHALWTTMWTTSTKRRAQCEEDVDSSVENSRVLIQITGLIRSFDDSLLCVETCLECRLNVKHLPRHLWTKRRPKLDFPGTHH